MSSASGPLQRGPRRALRFSFLLCGAVIFSALLFTASRWVWRAPPGERAASVRSAPSNARREAAVASPSQLAAAARTPAPHVATAPLKISEPRATETVPSELLASEPPHPITPAHQRIFEENQRIAALNDALDRGDAAELRRMNEEYRQSYPEDEHVLQEGYALLADCLEETTPRVLEAAQRFWHEQRASSLRRYVRRHCLSGQVP